MTKKHTAHRPSQSNMKYVTTQDSQKVNNTIYVPSQQSTHSSVASPSGVLSQKTDRDYYDEWKQQHDHVKYSFDDMQHKLSSDNTQDRIFAAKNGYRLDVLKNDNSVPVRVAVARQGYALHELQDDEDNSVRREVAIHGYGLDKLKNDENLYVRAEVAKQGYALNELKNDDCWLVRVIVAQQGYALDELKNDNDESVRLAVVNNTDNKDMLNEMTGNPNKEVATTATVRLKKLSE